VVLVRERVDATRLEIVQQGILAHSTKQDSTKWE
jgi:hypothetical protein